MIAASGAWAQYDILRIDPIPGYDFFRGYDLSDAGQIAGTCANIPWLDLDRLAVRYSPGIGLEDIGSEAASDTVAVFINEAGQVAGYTNFERPGQKLFRFTPAEGTSTLGAPAFIDESTWLSGLGANGELVGGAKGPGGWRPFLYTDATSWLLAGEIHPDFDAFSRFDAINNTGQIAGAIGQPGAAYAFRFQLGADPLYVPEAEPPVTAYAADINDAGAFCGSYFPPGAPDRHAFRFDDSDGFVDIHPPHAGGSQSIYGSETGAVMGFTIEPLVITGVFYWDPADGTFEIPFKEANIDPGAAFVNHGGISPDGVAYGDAYLESVGPQPWVWSKSDGLSFLMDIADPDDEYAAGIVADINESGQILVVLHLANHEDSPSMRTVLLTPTGGCYADFDGSGTLDLFDFLEYVNAFNAGDGLADCTEDGALNFFDFLCFVNAFNEGC
jgi:hypothetical protein